MTNEKFTITKEKLREIYDKPSCISCKYCGDTTLMQNYCNKNKTWLYGEYDGCGYEPKYTYDEILETAKNMCIVK